MKRAIYLFAVVVLTVGFVSCNNDNEEEALVDNSNVEANLELRAETLGYSDAATYRACVAEQCAAGNHENCDILPDGTHQACPYPEHCGTYHDGSRHNGKDHGTQNASGHSHNNSHGNGNGNGHHH